jgi:UDP-N-acetylglucosamine 1-carboxyvinyltransferase
VARLIIEGGRRLGGRHRVSGNKNAALPMLAACLLTDEPLCLRNLPLIDDVRTMLALLAALGVDVHLDEVRHTVRLHAHALRTTRLDPALCGRVRSSILFAGPLAARTGEAVLPPPGGDVIGRRRLDTHFEGLRNLGFHVAEADGAFVFRRAGAGGGGPRRLVLDEASVTATENLLMAASLSDHPCEVYNAACEPHVQDLCRLLQAMGAAVDGIGTNRVTVRGADRLHGASFAVGPDAIEAGGFVCAALATGSPLTIEGIDPEDFAVLARPFAKLGARWDLTGSTLSVPGNQDLCVRDDAGHAIPKIEDGPWPACPSDLMSALLVLATQTRGTILFFEKMFESRLYFVDHLIGMGARIVPCDPHRVVVAGPSPLHGSRVVSPDIRAGMALLIAALAARGTTTILNAESIDRGYARIDESLRTLGARIERRSD